jgi:hypothetical protein
MLRNAVFIVIAALILLSSGGGSGSNGGGTSTSLASAFVISSPLSPGASSPNLNRATAMMLGVKQAQPKCSAIRDYSSGSGGSSSRGAPLFACRYNAKKEKRLRNRENMRKFQLKRGTSRRKLVKKQASVQEQQREMDFMAKVFAFSDIAEEAASAAQATARK